MAEITREIETQRWPRSVELMPETPRTAIDKAAIEDWPETNRRRGYLIVREIAGIITTDQAAARSRRLSRLNHYRGRAWTARNCKRSRRKIS